MELWHDVLKPKLLVLKTYHCESWRALIKRRSDTQAHIKVERNWIKIKDMNMQNNDRLLYNYLKYI